MSKPIVAIVGRPNVGKSMLFNKLTGKRMAIVEDTPGVTRDRIYGECEWNGRGFALVDTGGIEPGTNNEMLKFMRRQAEIAIETATVIIMVVDVTVGLTAADAEVASMLKRSKKPVVLAVNKCDQTGHANPDAYEFYALGLGDPIEVSAVHGHGSCRGVVQVVRVEFGDALRPAVVAEQCVVISQCHGGDATLPQRLCGPPGKRAQSGTSVDVVRVGRSGSQQHVAVAFEHQTRGAVLGLFQIGLRVQGLAHVEFDGGRIRRQRFHGGCWRAGHVDVVFRGHVARRVGDGDGEFAAEAGG